MKNAITENSKDSYLFDYLGRVSRILRIKSILNLMKKINTFYFTFFFVYYDNGRSYMMIKRSGKKNNYFLYI